MSQYLYGSTSVVQKCFLKMLFLEVSQNQQECTCAGVYFQKPASLRLATLLKGDSSTCAFSRTPILCLSIVCYANKVIQKIPHNSWQNSCERLLLLLVRIGLVWPAANLLMFCRIDCKSVLKVLSFSTEMQSSADSALMSTQSMY